MCFEIYNQELFQFLYASSVHFIATTLPLELLPPRSNTYIVEGQVKLIREVEDFCTVWYYSMHHFTSNSNKPA